MNAIKLLSEVMSVYDLSPEQAAGYVGCSGSQIRRWLAGRFEPTAVYVQAIVRGVVDEAAVRQAIRDAGYQTD